MKKSSNTLFHREKILTIIIIKYNILYGLLGMTPSEVRGSDFPTLFSAMTLKKYSFSVLSVWKTVAGDVWGHSGDCRPGSILRVPHFNIVSC